MMNKNAFTQVSALSAILTILNSIETTENGTYLVGTEEINVEALTEKVEAMRETLMNKKSTSPKVSAAKEAELGEFSVEVTAVLSGAEHGMTISEMQKASEFLAGFSNQKVSAMLRKLAETGSVTKEKEGKKTVFSIAA